MQLPDTCGGVDQGIQCAAPEHAVLSRRTERRVHIRRHAEGVLEPLRGRVEGCISAEAADPKGILFSFNGPSELLLLTDKYSTDCPVQTEREMHPDGERTFRRRRSDLHALLRASRCSLWLWYYFYVEQEHEDQAPSATRPPYARDNKIFYPYPGSRY